MSGSPSNQRSRRRGYRRLLSHQFSFNSLKNSKDKGVAKEKKVDGPKELKAHPVLKVLDARSKEKAVMKPEFLRYLEYMKEAGKWDTNSDRPTMYFN